MVFGCLNVAEHGMTLTGNRTGKAYVKIVARSCNRMECPVCYKKAIALEAHRAAYRLAAYQGPSRRPIHVSVSPPKEAWLVEGRTLEQTFLELRRRAYKVARKAGLRGGNAVWHPWREHKDANGRGLGDWYWSPHFHIIGYGWVKPNAYELTGWVVKNHGLRESVHSTLTYLLSHAGVWTQRRDPEGILPVAKSTRYHTVTWWGCCSYNKLKVVKEKVEKELCPLCKSELVPLVWLGDGDPGGGHEGEFWLDAAGWLEVTKHY